VPVFRFCLGSLGSERFFFLIVILIKSSLLCTYLWGLLDPRDPLLWFSVVFQGVSRIREAHIVFVVFFSFVSYFIGLTVILPCNFSVAMVLTRAARRKMVTEGIVTSRIDKDHVVDFSPTHTPEAGEIALV
jgi:hypothetical protein